MRRTSEEVCCKSWSVRAKPTKPVPCLLCDNAEFNNQEEFQQHVDKEHGGLQRYRNAFFALSSLQPTVVKGQAWRVIVANYSEFLARSATGWSKFNPEMKSAMASSEGLSADQRWSERALQACVFCTRRLWKETLREEYLAGPECFMKTPNKVADLLAWEKYHERSNGVFA